MTFEDIIAEFQGLVNEMTKEDIIELQKRGKDLKTAELLMLLDRKSQIVIETLYNQSIIMLNSHLELRSVKEKIEFLNKRRHAMFADLEDENIKGLNHVLEMEIGKIPQLFTMVVNFIPDIIEKVPDEISNIIDKARAFGTFPEVGQVVENPKEKIEPFLEMLHSLSETRPELAKIITAKRPIRSAITSALYLWYDKKYLLHLNELVNSLENPPIAISDNSSEKIGWLGTQAELAELSIELQNKGWIPKVTAGMIKSHFSNSDSIDQYLQPYTDTKTGENLYTKIYGSRYKPKFSKIEKIAKTKQ